MTWKKTDTRAPMDKHKRCKVCGEDLSSWSRDYPVCPFCGEYEPNPQTKGGE